MYLSGLAFMIGGILAKSWAEVRVVVPMIAIWTGMLLVVSLFNAGEFDYSRVQVWTWYGAYFVYPLIALWLAWLHRADTAHPERSATVPLWVRRYLITQGLVVTLLALALLIQPTLMVSVWPWKATPLLVQIYASPFLSYGLGSLMMSRQRSWMEIRVGVMATLIFSALVLVASLIHRQLFSFADTPDRLWFLGFGVATAMLATISLRAFVTPSSDR
jgi:hypothetical protein